MGERPFFACQPGPAFTAAAGDIGYSWTCKCHNDDIPDIENVLVTGRIIDGRAVIEDIAQEYPS